MIPSLRAPFFGVDTKKVPFFAPQKTQKSPPSSRIWIFGPKVLGPTGELTPMPPREKRADEVVGRPRGVVGATMQIAMPGNDCLTDLLSLESGQHAQLFGPIREFKT